MRFSHRLKKEEIPEWEDCYINYKNLKILLKFVKSSATDRIEFEKSIFRDQIGVNPYHPSTYALQNLVVPPDQMENYVRFKQTSEKANSLLFQSLNSDVQLLKEFFQYKLQQNQRRFAKALNYHLLTKKDEKCRKKVVLPYVQNIFIESFNLSQMYETNVDEQRRILNKHQLNIYQYFQTPKPRITQQLDIKKMQKLIREIESFYIKISGQKIQKCRGRIRELASQRVHRSRDSLIIGIMIGIFLGVCVFLGAMLIYLKNQVQMNPIFNVDFPLWRGITLFVLYIWSLGINLHHYEKFNINHRNIMQNNCTKYPTSVSFFKVAGFFSAIIIIVFTIYALDVAQVIQLRTFNPQYLPLFVWLPFIAFLINPISIFYYHTRTYMIKVLWQSLISWIIPVTYPLVFVTDQFVSLFVPLQDSVYTLCYYVHFKPSANNSQTLQSNNCQSAASVTIFVFSIVIFSYRIMQCIKCGFQSRPFNIPDFFNGLKYTVALVSTILSYILNDNRERIFVAWLIFAILTSIYTYFWDLKYDWILLARSSHRALLRDRISYPKKMYYVLIVANLFLRTSWVLTISTGIVNGFLGSPQVFILLFSFLQICRRGVWNVLSVQAQHTKNCNALNAAPKSFINLDKKIDKELQENKDKINQNSIQRLIADENIPHDLVPTLKFQDSMQDRMDEIMKKVLAQNAKNKQMKIMLKDTHCHDEMLIDYMFNDRFRY